MTTWLDSGRCSTCKYCGMDMDMEPFCVHPTVKKENPLGLYINSAIRDYCGQELKLRVEDERRVKMQQDEYPSDNRMTPDGKFY